ncbi:hypothetical protein DSCO28_60040 [Desulfosarcina ovata subsp. sediminis]|uniref:Ferrous iron transporter FeoA-like domain-containing protein n=1 Tax=Desulfosarcina ovata subsp. sediminis TaxID=885957 RepID=A0A5K7ZYY9_9BACT|nr:FeoA family protein [Desulfosarcina ovata]BBO85438.1 hypothetical protein DSCO28_60040 [Desulfosarcina ovata subsp. sediminis]
MNTKALTQLASGTNSRIVRIRGGHHFLSRVTSIGFTIGTPVLVLQNYRRLPLLVYLRDTQVAIDRREAEKIYVDET